MEKELRMDTENKKEYSYSNSTGDAMLTVYTVFPGIQVTYNSVHMDSFDLSFKTKGNLIEIHHCSEGRIEQEFDNQFFYLMPGDLSIAIRNKSVEAYNFPLRHYHGITITIDADVAPKCFSTFLKDVKVQPLEVAKRLCQDKSCFILRSEAYVEHIFSELYTFPEEQKIGYLKIKILELLYVLNRIDPANNKTADITLPRVQVQLAKQAAAYLSENMNKHITISELSKKFGVSDTYLKNVFKGVYGVPVFSYMRIQKMQSASQMLISTDCSIAQIAYEFGYSNESKFSAAFKEIMGESPGKYRKTHTKLTII